MKRTVLNHRLKKAIKILQRIRCIYLCIILVALFLFSGFIYKRPDVIYGICEKFQVRKHYLMEPFDGKYKKLSAHIGHKEGKTDCSLAVVSLGHTDIIVTYNYNLILVNATYPLKENNSPILTNYENTDHFIAKEAEEPLKRLFTDARKATGEAVGVTSLYRSKEKQEMLYETDSKIAAFPGFSEHETGLAVDLKSNRYAQRYFIKSKVGQWMNENCAAYGFIIRYPYGEEKVTGFSYEPWHIRYVGCPHAEIIYQNRLTLEEYLEKLETGIFYRYYDTVFGAFDCLADVMVPKDTISIWISPDNTGRYIVTCRQFATVHAQ